MFPPQAIIQEIASVRGGWPERSSYLTLSWQRLQLAFEVH
jgi:hypothetical protein